ncbi:hypothetical protein H5J22_05875 [Cetobacterium sp. 8H]|uniref:hypothetical protein n=1 Tax=Cetobacterium sp. 8H TaxID=2759681 RepID=UPI00163CF24D|nr:hypothetical protein [Cetobacterium sp. 8H]MBC2850966.1 hypothetical protein [Cetobacterium sp. 8H]
MSLTKKLMIYLSIFAIFFIGMSYISKDYTDYIFISNNHNTVDIFNSTKEKTELFQNENNEIKKIRTQRYMNGLVSNNVPEGEYLLKIKDNPTKEKVINKSKEPFKKKYYYTLKKENLKDIIFLSVFTGLFILYNGVLFYSFKAEILKRKELIFPLILLFIKMFFTNPLTFSNILVMHINIGITSILGLYLLIYVNEKKIRKKDRITNFFIGALFFCYLSSEIFYNSIIFNADVLNYIMVNLKWISKILLPFYTWIDATVIILLIYFIDINRNQKSEIIKKIITKKNLTILSFLILSIVVDLIRFEHRFYFYLNMFEFTFIYWYIFLIDVNLNNKYKLLAIKVFQMFVHLYLFYVFTKSIDIVLWIMVSFIVLNIHTYLFTGALKVDKNYTEGLLNRMYLTRNMEEFEEQLSKEVKKTLGLVKVKIEMLLYKEDYKKYLKDREYDESEIIIDSNDILCKDEYDYAVRLKYGKKPFLGLVLIKSQNLKLAYEEKKYLEMVSEKVSLVSSRYRMLKLQEELDCEK